MWTMVSFIITRDKKFISIKKIALNPSVVAMYIALVLFFSRIKLTGQVADMVTLLSKMCTPLCMLILGMRLALVPIKPMFTSGVQYAALILKLIVFPLVTLAICSLLPVEREFVIGLYILGCAPVGNMVLSFAELLGEGQDTAANVVLLSTLLSMLTIPVMLLII
jgi:predicted permease